MNRAIFSILLALGSNYALAAQTDEELKAMQLAVAAEATRAQGLPAPVMRSSPGIASGWSSAAQLRMEGTALATASALEAVRMKFRREIIVLYPRNYLNRGTQRPAIQYKLTQPSRLERINQIELKPVEVRFLLPGRSDGFVGRRRVVFQFAVQRASMPPGEAGHGVWTQLPQSVHTVLQDVGWRALITFGERGQHRILFLAKPRITELHIVLFLQLTKAGIHPIFFVLTFQIAEYRTFRIQRVRLGIEVVFKFEQ